MPRNAYRESREANGLRARRAARACDDHTKAYHKRQNNSILFSYIYFMVFEGCRFETQVSKLLKVLGMLPGACVSNGLGRAVSRRAT